MKMVRTPYSSVDTTPEVVPDSEASTLRSRKKKRGEAISVDRSCTPPNILPMDSAQHANYVKQGKLSFMTKFPRDILFEIFGQLEPVDLLHISRANKDLRNILIASNANILWKSAYQNLTCPPPICPPGVNLRHFTNFLYGRYCQFCASVYREGGFTHWMARVRLCEGCISKHMIDGPVPRTCRYYLSGQSRNRSLEDDALQLCTNSDDNSGYIHFPDSYVLKIEYDRILQALQAAKDDAVSTNDFRSEQKRLLLERYQYGSQVMDWWTLQQAEQAENVRKRRNEVIERIEAEGFCADYDRIPVYDLKLPSAKDNFTKELSDQDWERIKPGLIRLLESRRRILRKEIIEKLRLRIDQLSQIVTKFYSKTPTELFIIPPIVHFARMPSIANLIKDIHKPSLVASSTIRDLKRQIPGITASWREAADNCLRDLLPQKSASSTRKGKGKGVSISCLELATSFFKCHWCQEPISYPRILMHGCLRDRVLDEEDNADKDESKHVDADIDSIWNQKSFWYGEEWNEGNNQITFDDEASGFAQVIVKACRKDSGEVTFDEMNNLDARVECLRCFKGGRNPKRLIMNWTTAILHDIDKHFKEAPNEKGWLLMGKQDTAKAKELESKLSSKWYSEGFSHTITRGTPLSLDTPIRRPPYAVKI